MRIPMKGWLVGGLLGGLLDLTFALGYGASKGIPSTKVLQTVASGLLGTRSFELGQTSAIMGVMAHFTLSLIWAVLFYRFVAGRRWSPWVTGPLFGILVFLAMRLIVLPISAFPYPVRFSMPGALYDLLSHMFLFGLPIALMIAGARRRLPASGTLMGCLATPGST